MRINGTDCVEVTTGQYKRRKGYVVGVLNGKSVVAFTDKSFLYNFIMLGDEHIIPNKYLKVIK